MDRYTGGRLCGNVRLMVTGRPYRVGLCHCMDCRKHHGALIHACAIFPDQLMPTYESWILRRESWLPASHSRGDTSVIATARVALKSSRLADAC